jgi:hypothetical protein
LLNDYMPSRMDTDEEKGRVKGFASRDWCGMGEWAVVDADEEIGIRKAGRRGGIFVGAIGDFDAGGFLGEFVLALGGLGREGLGLVRLFSFSNSPFAEGFSRESGGPP